MSLLDRPNTTITVYPQETWTDADGNTGIRPAVAGTPTPARIQPQPQSGTSSRRAEQMDEGWFSEEVYNLRFPKGSPGDDLAQAGSIGLASEIDWDGQRWTVFGMPMFYNGSRRTRRLEFVIRRS